jgi:hypothetical protein
MTTGQAEALLVTAVNVAANSSYDLDEERHVMGCINADEYRCGHLRIISLLNAVLAAMDRLNLKEIN